MKTTRKPVNHARKVKKNFGRDVQVIVSGEESTYHNIVGTIVNGVITMDGTYLVSFGPPTGDQFIHANDLDEYESGEAMDPAPLEEPSHITQSTPVPIDLISPDPDQPRKTFPPDELQELADSLALHKLLQPILIRPMPFHDNLYIIVFGERRWRAAQLIGWKAIPAYIREMSADEALELQVIENLQRSDVHPMQEARAFKSMHNRMELEEVAHRVNKKASYISVRLRLNELIPEFQEIYLYNKMDFEDAQLLSRATPENQQLILTERTTRLAWKDPNWSLGNIDWLVRKHSNNLDNASFKTEDPELFPEMGACGQCPFNSAVNELFADVEGRICNNPTCYSIKTQRGYQVSLKEVVADPGTVMISQHPNGDEDAAKVRAAEDIGGIVLKDREYEVVRKEEMPTWESFLEHEDTEDPSWNETDARAEFEEELKGWREAQEDFKNAEAAGLVKQAFVVAGSGAGHYQTIKITSAGANKVGELSTGTAAKIAELQDQEKRARQLDREKVAIKTQELLASEAGARFNRNHNSLYRVELVGLIQLLWSFLPTDLRPEFLEELEIDRSNVTRGEMVLFEALSKMTVSSLDILKDRMIRPILANNFTVKDIPDYKLRGECATLRAIAQEYYPEELAAMDEEQNAIASKRSARVQQRIAELQPKEVPSKPQPLRMEHGRRIIKHQNPDSPQAWKWLKLEGPFADEAALKFRYQELLATGKYVEA